MCCQERSGFGWGGREENFSATECADALMHMLVNPFQATTEISRPGIQDQIQMIPMFNNAREKSISPAFSLLTGVTLGVSTTVSMYILCEYQRENKRRHSS